MLSGLAPRQSPCRLCLGLYNDQAEAAVTDFEYGIARMQIPTRRRCNCGIKGRYSRGLWFCAPRPSLPAVSDQKRVVSDHILLQVRSTTTLVLRLTRCAAWYAAAGLESVTSGSTSRGGTSVCFLSVVRVNPIRIEPWNHSNRSPILMTPADASAVTPATQYLRKDSFDDIVERGTKSKSKPFLSTTDRREGGAFESKETASIPGPGAYNLESKPAVPPPRSRAQTRPRLPQGGRFDTMNSQNDVGPGSHEVSGSLIKKTFNITFGGACTPAGASRVHRASLARKHYHVRDFSGSVPPGACGVIAVAA